MRFNKAMKSLAWKMLMMIKLESLAKVRAILIQVAALLDLLREFLFPLSCAFSRSQFLPMGIQGVTHSLTGQSKPISTNEDSVHVKKGRRMRTERWQKLYETDEEHSRGKKAPREQKKSIRRHRTGMCTSIAITPIRRDLRVDTL